VLNVTTNHLDRHESFGRYRAAKARIFACQGTGSWAILNADDPASFGMREAVRGRIAAFSRTRRVAGACMAGDGLRLTLPWASGPICRRQALARPGAHHEENALAAACIAGLLEVDPGTIGQVLRSFRGLPHRQEVVATVRGVTFVNDSKATTVAAGLRAIQAAPGRVILIAGGRDKGSDFRPLRSCSKKLKAAVLIGEDAPKIAAHLEGRVPHRMTDDLETAVETAFSMAGSGEWVLLSPMCASFDMFRDFEERGERFMKVVHGIAGKEERGCAL